MPRTIAILTLWILLAAGCRSPRYNAEDQPPAEPQLQADKAFRKAVSSPTHLPVVQPLPATNRDFAPWVPVKDWARFHQLPPPQRISTSTNPVFEVRSDRGQLTFQIHTKTARFKGVTLMLGFEPTVFGGEPCLHELDVVKNLEPLLLASACDATDRQLIVIDPGHGGGNTGTRSAEGKLEKDYTLDWALRLRPLLETNGWKVLLTRTNDVELTLPERVAIAEAVDADLFISLHFNASGGGNHQSGLETYCLTPTGMPSTLVRDDLEDVSADYPNNTFDSENLQLALCIHRSLLQVTEAKDRGIKRARFMGVLRGQNRPAILVEGGFLSNPEEARRIDSANYRQQLAEAVAVAVAVGSGLR